MPRTVVVVVEDDPMNRLLAIDAMERAGFEVADFSNTNAARSYAECMPDSIAGLLADIDVPGDSDGIALATTFAERWPEKTVIVTSGCFGPDRPEDLPLAAAFLPKPWTAQALMHLMTSAVEGSA